MRPVTAGYRFQLFGIWNICLENFIKPFIPHFNRQVDIAEAVWLEWISIYVFLEVFPVLFGTRGNREVSFPLFGFILSCVLCATGQLHLVWSVVGLEELFHSVVYGVIRNWIQIFCQFNILLFFFLKLVV